MERGEVGGGLRLVHVVATSATIAVLAVLAAPVLMARSTDYDMRGAVSWGAVKRLSIATLMYSADNDFRLPLGTAWHAGKSDQLCLPMPIGCFSTWAWSVQPYLASSGSFEDVTVHAPLWPYREGIDRFATLYTDYGYNYVNLSPFLPSDGSKSQPRVIGISETAAEDEGNTVLLASKWSRHSSPNVGLWATALPGGMLADAGIDPPVCSTLPQMCFSNWGEGGFFDQRDPSKGLLLNDTEGRLTGGVALRTQEKKAVVGFLDGHVKKITAYNLASGTNWTPSKKASELLITDQKRYRWSLEK